MPTYLIRSILRNQEFENDIALQTLPGSHCLTLISSLSFSLFNLMLSFTLKFTGPFLL